MEGNQQRRWIRRSPRSVHLLPQTSECPGPLLPACSCLLFPALQSHILPGPDGSVPQHSALRIAGQSGEELPIHSQSSSSHSSLHSVGCQEPSEEGRCLPSTRGSEGGVTRAVGQMDICCSICQRVAWPFLGHSTLWGMVQKYLGFWQWCWMVRLNRVGET